MRELRYGSFRREFALPEGVTVDDISAHYDAGMLEVRIGNVTKPVEAPRKVEITSRRRAANGTQSDRGSRADDVPADRTIAGRSGRNPPLPIRGGPPVSACGRLARAPVGATESGDQLDRVAAGDERGDAAQVLDDLGGVVREDAGHRQPAVAVRPRPALLVVADPGDAAALRA